LTSYNLTFRITGDSLFVTPDPDSYTPYSPAYFDIYASDTTNRSAYQRINIWIEGINDPPYLDSLIPDIIVMEEEFGWAISVIDLSLYFNDSETYAHSLDYELSYLLLLLR